jgi:hypothetical protein
MPNKEISNQDVIKQPETSLNINDQPLSDDDLKSVTGGFKTPSPQATDPVCVC